MTPADHRLCHVKKQPAILQCSSPLQKLATWRSSALARQFEPKAPRWRSEMELLHTLFLHPQRRKRETLQ